MTEQVTAEQIKDALRSCTSVPSVNECAKQFAKDVARLTAGTQDDKTMAIQIKNLASYRRKMLMR